MRCRCCNNKLSENELTRKYSSTGEFTDTCNICWDLTGRQEGVLYNKDGGVDSYYKIPDNELDFGSAFGMDALGDNPIKQISESGFISMDEQYIWSGD